MKKMNIERILAYVLALLLVVSAVYFPDSGVNAAYVTDERAVDLLEKLEIGTYTGEGVTRLEFAEMIMKAVDAYENNTEVTESVFADVEGIAVSYVNPAVELGYFKVPENKKFRPYDKITYEEAVAVCVRALGYDKLVSQSGGLFEYVGVARRLDILSGVSASGFDASAACRLVYNMLHGKVAANTYTNNGLSEIEIGTKTLLEEIYGIAYLSGRVTSINGLSVLGSSVRDASYIVIDGVEYYALDKYESEKYLGIYVDFYATELNGRSTVFAMYESREIKTLVLYGDDVEKVSDDLRTLTYIKNNSSKNVSLSKDITVIYNNSGKFSVSPADFIGEDVTVILTDTDGDSVYDGAVIEKPEYFRIASVNEAYREIYFYDSNSAVTLSELAKEEDLEIVSQSGVSASLSDLSAGSYVEVLMTKTKSGEIDYTKAIKIIILEQKVSGKVEAVKTGERIAVIGGTEYRYISSVADEIRLGTAAEFYIGSCGSIVMTGELSTDGNIYGWWVAAKKEDGISDDIKVKIFTQNNQMKIFNTDKRVKFSGYIGGTYTDGKAIDSELLLSYVTKPQLIKFRADENGILKEVVTAYDHSSESSYEGYDDERFSLEYYNKNGWLFNVVVNQDYFFDSSSVIFSIPEDGDDDEYMAEKYSYYAEQSNIEMYAYDANDKWVVAAGVIISSSSGAAEPDNDVIADEYIAVISQEINVLAEDGTAVKGYKAYCRGEEIELMPYKETLSDKIISVPTQGEKSEIFFNELNPGDIVQCWKNSAGKVYILNVMHRFNKNNPQPAYYTIEPNSAHLSVCITDFGVVTETKPDSYFKLESTDKRYNFADKRQAYYIYEFDTETGEVTVLDSFGALNDKSGKNPDYVFAKRRRTTVRDMVIYRTR